MTFFWSDPLTLAEPLADGRFRCRTCQATWWPMLDGMLQPTLASWIVPIGFTWALANRGSQRRRIRFVNERLRKFS